MSQPNAPTPPQALQQPQDDEIDLGYLLAVCWDHRGTLAGITALFTLLSLVYALLATPVYRADALLQVEQASGGLGGDLQFLLGEEQSSSTTQMEILRSRMILASAVEQRRLDITVEPAYLPLIGKPLARHEVARPAFARGWASVWGGEEIHVRRLGAEEALYGVPLTLTVLDENRFTLEDEAGAALGEGRVGEAFLHGNPRVELLVDALQAAPGARFTLYKQSPATALQDLKERFNVSERGRDSGILEVSLTGEDAEQIRETLDAISQAYLIQNINRQAAEAEQSLVFLEKQVPEIRGTLTQSEDKLNAYRAGQESVDLDFETESMLQRLVAVEGQLNELKLTEVELAERFTTSHPAYRALLEKKAQLANEKARLEGMTQGLPEAQQEVLRLTRDVEVTQQIYMQMLNSMQELRIAKAGTVGNVRVLDDAQVGTEPIAPKRKLIVIVGTMAGLMLGLMLVLIRRMAHKGVENVEQLTELGLPVYATVPLSEAQLNLLQRGGGRGRKKAKLAGLGRGRRRPGKEELGGVLGFSSPTDLSIEALRNLRTSLHFAMLEADNKVLMITGPSPAVGKSFISVNLAAVCAQAGQRVLLLDADLRKGHVHTAFRDANTHGLSDYLTGGIDLNGLIKPSGQEGLSYAARGKAPPNPSELLMHDNFSRLLRQAGEQYDLIIVDTPPALAVTDASIVGQHAAITLMVVRFHLNPPKEIARALQLLEGSGVKVKGAILNAVEKTAAASYSYGYGYGYGYGYYNYAYNAEN